VENPSGTDIDARLAAFVPASAKEAGDVARARALVAWGDPYPRSLPLHITGSALVVHPPTRRVLLRWHERQERWMQVGGHGDPGESDPLEVARREAREETGLDDVRPWPSDEIAQVVIVDVPGNDREPAHQHCDVRFILATDSPEAATPENSIAELRWLSVDDAIRLTPEANVQDLIARAERLFSRLSSP
jgi:8-oxo-dGTP pyrophosphatase MutT (NUDIX family)